MNIILKEYFDQYKGAFTPDNKNFIHDAVIQIVTQSAHPIPVTTLVSQATQIATKNEQGKIRNNSAALNAMPYRVENWIKELIYRKKIVLVDGEYVARRSYYTAVGENVGEKDNQKLDI